MVEGQRSHTEEPKRKSSSFQAKFSGQNELEFPSLLTTGAHQWHHVWKYVVTCISLHAKINRWIWNQFYLMQTFLIHSYIDSTERKNPLPSSLSFSHHPKFLPHFSFGTQRVWSVRWSNKPGRQMHASPIGSQPVATSSASSSAQLWPVVWPQDGNDPGWMQGLYSMPGGQTKAGK